MRASTDPELAANLKPQQWVSNTVFDTTNGVYIQRVEFRLIVPQTPNRLVEFVVCFLAVLLARARGDSIRNGFIAFFYYTYKTVRTRYEWTCGNLVQLPQ